MIIQVAAASILIGTVTHVRGGDSIIVDDTPVQLQGIAAPGLRQPGGEKAKAFLVQQVLGRDVRCELTGESSAGGMIGICYWRQTDIGQLVVQHGLARDCPRLSNGRYAKHETKAGKQLPLPTHCGAN